MDGGPLERGRRAAGGTLDAAPEIEAAASAVALRMSYRELVGLRPEDAGSPVEQMIALAVLERAMSNAEAAFAEAEREAKHG